jgi:hypothetical protein
MTAMLDPLCWDVATSGERHCSAFIASVVLFGSPLSLVLIPSRSLVTLGKDASPCLSGILEEKDTILRPA